MTFSTKAKLQFNLGDTEVNTIDKVLKALDKVFYLGGATSFAPALRTVRKAVVPRTRRDSHRVMMFITDGMSNIGGPPKKEARRLRDEEDFTIYVIGKILTLLNNEYQYVTIHL